MSDNIVWFVPKDPIAERWPFKHEGCYGWVQVCKMIGADAKFGIERGIILPVKEVFENADVTVVTPESSNGLPKLRRLILSQYNWITFDQIYLTSKMEKLPRVGDKVVIKGKGWGKYKGGMTCKITGIEGKHTKHNWSEPMVEISNPKVKTVWVYAKRVTNITNISPTTNT